MDLIQNHWLLHELTLLETYLIYDWLVGGAINYTSAFLFHTDVICILINSYGTLWRLHYNTHSTLQHLPCNAHVSGAWLECRALNREKPGSNPLAAISKL